MRSVAGIATLCAAGALAAAIAATGCTRLECGENTIEIDGKCEAADMQPNRECGPGTVYDPESGRCVNEVFENGGGICGPNTTVEVTDAGVRVCVGTGGGGGCEQPLPCPVPTESNAVSLCGRIYDLEDSRPLDDGIEGNGEPHKTIEVRVLDPIAFISSTSPPIIARVLPDSCGRYVIANAQRPATGFIAVATEDITDAGGQPVFGDDHVITGIADVATAGQQLPGQRAWVLRRSTDQTWSTAAGLTGGDTFGRMGVYIPIFISGNAVAPFPSAPTRDVRVAIVDQGSGMRQTRPAQDFYFDDANPLERKNLLGTRETTGANGTGLFIMQSGLANFSGLGGAPGGTCWAINFAAAPVGGAFVQERTAEERFCP
jgi:hypothetical protein